MCTPTQLHDDGFSWFMIVWCRNNTHYTGVTSVCKEDLSYLIFFYAFVSIHVYKHILYNVYYFYINFYINNEGRFEKLSCWSV